MSAPVTYSLLITGHFKNPDFCQWIAHRAELLSLSGWVAEHGEGVLEVRVRGNQILVDAMETACSLGPLDALVESIEMRQSNCADCHSGFTIHTSRSAE